MYAPLASAFYGQSGEESSGGAERQAFMLARSLCLQGFRVAHIVYPVPTPALSTPGLPTIVERGEPRSRRQLGGLGEVASIWKALRRADAAVYIFRGASAGHLVAAAAFCRVFRRKLVFSGSSDLDFDLRRPDRNRPKLLLYGLAMGQVDRVVAQTEQQLGLARRAFSKLDRPTVIRSFAEPCDSQPLDPQAFLWADRLVTYKCPDRYLELAAAMPEARFRMVIPVTGETPSAMLDRLRAAADRLPNLELLGRMPRSELLELVRRSAAVVSTSLAEGMPNTFLEAWARGVPVLTLHVDPDGIVAKRQIGYAADGSWDRFLDGAATLWSEPVLRVEMGERARRYIEEVHSPPAVVNRWTEILSEALAA